MLPQIFVQVPRAAWGDIGILLEMPVEELERLVTFLQTAKPYPDIEDLAEAANVHLSIGTEVADAVITIAVSFSSVLRQASLTPEETIDAIEASLEQSRYPGWDEGRSAEWVLRRDQLGRLLGESNAITTMSKARQLLNDSPNIFRGVRCVTDIRHIFDESATRVTGGLVLQTLVVTYTSGEDTKEIHLALTQADIAELKSKLERSQSKTDVSLKVLEANNIPELTPKRFRQS